MLGHAHVHRDTLQVASAAGIRAAPLLSQKIPKFGINQGYSANLTTYLSPESHLPSSTLLIWASFSFPDFVSVHCRSIWETGLIDF